MTQFVCHCDGLCQSRRHWRSDQRTAWVAERNFFRRFVADRSVMSWKQIGCGSVCERLSFILNQDQFLVSNYKATIHEASLIPEIHIWDVPDTNLWCEQSWVKKPSQWTAGLNNGYQHLYQLSTKFSWDGPEYNWFILFSGQPRRSAAQLATIPACDRRRTAMTANFMKMIRCEDESFKRRSKDISWLAQSLKITLPLRKGRPHAKDPQSKPACLVASWAAALLGCSARRKLGKCRSFFALGAKRTMDRDWDAKGLARMARIIHSCWYAPQQLIQPCHCWCRLGDCRSAASSFKWEMAWHGTPYPQIWGAGVRCTNLDFMAWNRTPSPRSWSILTSTARQYKDQKGIVKVQRQETKRMWLPETTNNGRRCEGLKRTGYAGLDWNCAE